MRHPCLGRIAVSLLTLAAIVLLASCENSLTEVTPEDLRPLYDLDCGLDYGDPCEIDGIQVCANSGDCDDDSGAGSDWPDDPWSGGSPGGGGDSGGGGGDGGASGDGDDVCANSGGGYPDEDCGGGGSANPGDGDADYLDLPWDEICHLYADPGCEWRDPTEWTEGERAAIEASIEIVKARCKPEGDLLGAYLNTRRIHLWDARVERVPDAPALQGRVEPKTDDILMWTGYNKQPHDIVNWTETLTHEAIHLTLDTTRHPPEFYERLEECT